MTEGPLDRYGRTGAEPPIGPAPDVVATLGLDESRRTRWGSGRIVAGTVVALGALFAFAMVGDVWRGGDPTTYRTELVARGPLVSQVSATGALAPLTEVEVGTEVSGTVDSVYVDFNQRVTRGQVLARINTERLEASAEQARANLALAEAQQSEAQAGVLQAEADLGRRKRVHDLSGGEVPSQSDLDAAQAAYDRAVARERSTVAQIAQARAALDGFLSDLRRAKVVSPIDGVVLDRRVEAGQTVAATFQTPVLFALAGDLRQMQLSVDVDEADVGMVREGQESSFTVDAHPDRFFHARVTEVRFAPRTVGGVVTYETILAVDNAELLLRPGMTATAEIVVGRIDEALLVPNAALRFTPSAARHHQQEEASKGLVESLIPRPMASDGRRRGKAPRVWVLRDGAVVPVDLEIGSSDGTWTVVTKGELHVGDVVITDEQTKVDS
jgi:HlyD family secretion protein